jgi:hypothetical protein
MRFGRGNRSTRRKSAPLLILPNITRTLPGFFPWCITLYVSLSNDINLVSTIQQLTTVLRFIQNIVTMCKNTTLLILCRDNSCVWANANLLAHESTKSLIILSYCSRIVCVYSNCPSFLVYCLRSCTTYLLFNLWMHEPIFMKIGTCIMKKRT